MEDFKIEFADFLAKTYILSDMPKEESSNLWTKFNTIVLPNIPAQLFRFRPCNLDSIIAFERNTISACVASKFKDRHDSSVFVDKRYIRDNIKAFYDAGGVNALYKTKESGEIYNILGQIYGVETAQKLKQIYTSTPSELRAKILEPSYWDGFTEAIFQIIDNHINYIKNDRLTKIACFTEDVQSKYMWDSYADGYSGFALEYDLRQFVFNGCDTCKQQENCIAAEKSFTSILPIIYTDTRYNATASVINIILKELLQQFLSEEFLPPVDLLHWYKSYLYKSRDGYAQEKEWRMISRCPHVENSDYANIPDRSCLKAIYYGPHIEDRYKIHLRDIAKSKNIKEYNVTIDAESPKFELKIMDL